MQLIVVHMSSITSDPPWPPDPEARTARVLAPEPSRGVGFETEQPLRQEHTVTTFHDGQNRFFPLLTEQGNA
jgi:hypothetical protein